MQNFSSREIPQKCPSVKLNFREISCMPQGTPPKHLFKTGKYKKYLHTDARDFERWKEDDFQTIDTR